ncbi:MAG TPA: type II toxin-antitoxin system VapC family toxin [Bacteroidia bacterium]|nr:type II toxin-antitoxin system VapC family toxin [Bacteroidia bacterium]
MRVALDTNAYSDFLRGVPSRVEIVRKASRIYLPLIVLAELRAGFSAGSKQTQNLETLARFLKSPRVSMLVPDDRTTFHYAAIYARLRTEGTPIPTNDLWIAALVEQHGLPLCTSDGHFDQVPGLVRC